MSLVRQVALCRVVYLGRHEGDLSVELMAWKLWLSRPDFLLDDSLDVGGQTRHLQSICTTSVRKLRTFRQRQIGKAYSSSTSLPWQVSGLFQELGTSWQPKLPNSLPRQSDRSNYDRKKG